MAHVGNFFPRLMMPDKGPLNNQACSPPYRMRLITSPYYDGIQCAPWANQDVISEEPTWDKPIDGIEYIFLCPTSVFLDIRVKWTLQNTPTVTNNPFNLLVEFAIRFFDGGVPIASETGMLAYNDLALGANRLNYQFDRWTNSDDRAIVDKQYAARYCSARWSDVPSYTPRKLH